MGDEQLTACNTQLEEGAAKIADMEGKLTTSQANNKELAEETLTTLQGSLDSALEEKQSLEQEVKDLEGELSTVRANLESEQAQVQQQATQLMQQQQQSGAEHSQLVKELQTAQEKAVEEAKSQTKVECHLEETKSQLAAGLEETKAALADTQSELADTMSQLEEANKGNEELTNQGSEIGAKLKKESLKNKKLNGALEATQEDVERLSAVEIQLNEKVTSLGKACKAEAREKEEVTEELDDARGQILTLEEANRTLINSEHHLLAKADKLTRDGEANRELNEDGAHMAGVNNKRMHQQLQEMKSDKEKMSQEMTELKAQLDESAVLQKRLNPVSAMMGSALEGDKKKSGMQLDKVKEELESTNMQLIAESNKRMAAERELNKLKGVKKEAKARRRGAALDEVVNESEPADVATEEGAPSKAAAVPVRRSLRNAKKAAPAAVQATEGQEGENCKQQ